MKLNFLNALNGKVNHEEIAEQIIALEIKQKECENERNLSKILCKEVRGKTLCGEKISPDVIKNADKGYEEALLNLEIVTEGLEDLGKKLTVELEAYRQDEAKRISNMRSKLEQEREKVMREFAKAKGRLLGLAFGIYGHPAVARRHLEVLRSFTYTNTDQFHEEFEAEQNKIVAELKRPTFADLEEECQQKDRWLSSFNIDEEYALILKKYRDRHGVEVQEAQPVE